MTNWPADQDGEDRSKDPWLAHEPQAVGHGLELLMPGPVLS